MVEREKPLDSSVAVIAALGIIAPVWSRTMPLSCAVEMLCACTLAVRMHARVSVAPRQIVERYRFLRVEMDCPLVAQPRRAAGKLRRGHVL